MANVIFSKDYFNKMFTEKVQEYLANGYEFNLNSMGSSNGYKSVHLTNGQEVIKIQLETFCSYGEGDGMKLVIYKREAFADTDINAHNTLWESDCEIIETQEWIEIGKHRRGTRYSVYTQDKDFAKECTDKMYARYRRDYDKESEIRMETKEKQNFIRDLCRTHKGYASICRRHLKKLTKTVHLNGEVVYKVYFNENCSKNALVIKRVKK